MVFLENISCPKSCKIQLPGTFQEDILVNLNKITALSYPKKEIDIYFWLGEKHIAKKLKRVNDWSLNLISRRAQRAVVTS